MKYIKRIKIQILIRAPFLQSLKRAPADESCMVIYGAGNIWEAIKTRRMPSGVYSCNYWCGRVCSAARERERQVFESSQSRAPTCQAHEVRAVEQILLRLSSRCEADDVVETFNSTLLYCWNLF